MKKVLLAVVSLTLVFSGALEARVYKGQKEFMKKCKECHSSGQELAYSKNKRDWEAMLENKGKPMAALHLQRKKAGDSWEYFESSRYKKKSKDLKDFFTEYAKDSGNVPACN